MATKAPLKPPPLCELCGKPLTVLRNGATKHAACYHNRGRTPKPPTIGTCGHPVSRGSEKGQCADCYRKRGTTGRAEPKPLCRLCNIRPVSHKRYQVCRVCRDADRAGAMAVGAPNADDAIRGFLKGGAKPLDELARLLEQTPGQTLDHLLAMKARGVNLHELQGQWSLERFVPIAERTFEYVSRKDNTYVFGSASDQHLCSKYSREDVGNDLYDRFADAGVDRVFNAGNWIDGEAEFNRFDLTVHGLEPQVNYLVDKFPQRQGLTTYAIWGEDHEGWFSRREGIDVGRFAEGRMRDAGRTDWVDLGFIEARVDLVNANTGARQSLVIMHPGGGSSYAYSYRSQKLVESLSGGEKPAVLIIGHYHKLNCNVIRSVWTVQSGCVMDQSIFMRKKSLEAHVGGMIITLEQDPETGAIFRCVADQMIYFDKKYYNDRWSQSREVVKSPRFLGGVVPA